MRVSMSGSERAAASGHADNAVVDLEDAGEIVCDLFGPLAYASAAGRAGKRDLAVGNRHGDSEWRRGDADLVGESRTDFRLHEPVGERGPDGGGILEPWAFGEFADGLHASLDRQPFRIEDDVIKARILLLDIEVGAHCAGTSGIVAAPSTLAFSTACGSC